MPTYFTSERATVIRARRRRLPKVLTVSVIAMGVLMAVPDSALAVTRRTATEETLCNAGDEATCMLSASADPSSGTIRTAASLTSPALTAASGSARAAAGLTDPTMHVPKGARAVTVTATVRVNSAASAIDSLTTTANDAASSWLRLDVFTTCSACPDGVAGAVGTTALTDTDASTPEPTEIAGVTRTVTAVVALGPGEKFLGESSVKLRAFSNGQLDSSVLAPTDRRASATADVVLESITIQAS